MFGTLPKLMKRIFSFAAAMLVAASVSAVPARPGKFRVTQPDGTVLTIMARGDENFHFTCTEDGMPLVKGADGAYYYAKLDAAKIIVSTGQMAHDEAQRSADELSFLKGYEADASSVRSLGAELREKRNAARLARLAKTAPAKANAPKKTMAGAWGGEGIGVTGKRKGLVILVNFKDKAMQASHSQEEWNNFFNEEGYSKMGNAGSVHDYFKAQSYGDFDLTFDVVGPVTVSKNMADYGANDSYGNDVDPAGMVYEACQLVDSQVDFSQYDWDGDGEVDQVFLIYAGYGESSYPAYLPETIWPHEWDLYSGGYSLKLDGVTINTYGCSSELYGYTGTYMDGIGTPCHEFSHCLGLPDMYDTSGKHAFGLDDWGIMDSGCYGGDGYKPVGYNSYEKWVSGWLQPTELKSACYVNDMKALSDSPEAYIVYNEKTPTEYYLFENRQKKGTDSELPAHGMLVLHIDYDKNAWVNNVLNNTASHQRITILPADNVLTSYTVSGDTYPGTSNNTSITDTSSPAATLFNANTDGRKYLGKPVTDIAESDGKISFTFMGGFDLATPENLWTKDISEHGFTASWDAVEGAESYSVEMRQVSGDVSPAASKLAEGDFSGFGKTLTTEGTIDISDGLASKLGQSGWTGYKVFECPSKIKVGSSKVKGFVSTPLLSDLFAGNVTVRLKSQAYSQDTPTMTVSLSDKDGKEISSENVTVDGTMATVVLPNAYNKSCTVTVTPTKRGYIEYLAAYDGEFADSDFDSSSSSDSKAATKKEAVSSVTKGITELSCSYALLDEGIYRWRVQAVKGDVASAWSAWQQVTIGDKTSIDKVNDSVSASTLVDVYTISGVKVGSMSYSDFLASPIQQGVYVVKANGKATRILK